MQPTATSELIAASAESPITESQDLILEPLMGEGRPEAENEAKILTQIDRIAAARAELEKGKSKMLFSLLQVLTADQWTKLPARNGKLPLAPGFAVPAAK
jgi:hypothetical protein